MTLPVVGHLWVYLSASPLFWLTATLCAYLIGHEAHMRAGGSPLVNSVAIATAILITLLLATGTSYETYFEGAQFVHFLLGPATVALAIPLYDNFAKVRRALLPIGAALVAGSLTAAGSAIAIAWALGADPVTVKSLSVKSVTTPIAMAISEKIGGLPSLTAALVLLTGVTGAMMAAPLFNLMGIRDWRARGFAAGITAHGVGTARAFQVDDVAGTFAGIAMGLNGLATSIFVPLLVTLLHL